MSFTVSKLEDGRVKLSYDWAFEQSDKDALELFAELSVQRGEALERERIIKLLEKHDKETKAGNTDMAIKYRSAVLACIALVKGEQ